VSESWSVVGSEEGDSLLGGKEEDISKDIDGFGWFWMSFDKYWSF